jgi:hypothetical protein
MASLLFGCDSDNNDALIPEYEQAKYSANKFSCIDSNLNGHCNIGEADLLASEQDLLLNQSPALAVYDNFTLSAVAGSSLITPFTTLINNEVMHNPLVNGSIEQAKSYLSEKLSLDFSTLDKFDGPVSEGNQIIASIIKAQAITADNRYLPIAAMVDLMIYSNNLDVQTLQIHADALIYPDLVTGNSYLLDEDSNIRFSRFDLHPVTGRAIIVTSNNKLISLNANSGAYANIDNQAASQKTALSYRTKKNQKESISSALRNLNITTPRDGDDDDDDDDDDDYNDWFDYLNQTRSSDIKNIKQHINSNHFFILTSQEASTITDVCNPSGEYGLFLSNVQPNNENDVQTKVTNSRKMTLSHIDGFTSASTSTPVIDKPTVIPPIFDSEASCYNDAMITMASSIDSKLLAVVLNDGLGHIIYRLSGDSLTPTPNFGYRVPDFIALNHIALSTNGELLAYTEPESGKLSLIDTNKMKLLASYQHDNQKLSQVYFSDDKQLVAINTDQQELTFIDVIDNKLILNKSLKLDFVPSALNSNPIAKITVVANEKNITLVKEDNNNLTVKAMITDFDNTIEQVAVLSDKVVYTTGEAYLSGADTINYLSTNSIIGSPLRAAQQFLSAGILMENRSGVYYRTGSFYLPKNLDKHGIKGITIEWSSNRSEEINLDSGEVNTSFYQGSLLLSAKIRGDFRFESATITKAFKVN